MKNQALKFIALCAIVCGTLVNANAQTPTPSAAPGTPAQMNKMTPDQMVEARLTKMKTNLNLTDDQVAKIKPLMQAEVTARTSHDPAAMKANHAKMESEMGNILTPEQMTKYKAMAGPRGHMMGGAAPQKDN